MPYAIRFLFPGSPLDPESRRGQRRTVVYPPALLPAQLVSHGPDPRDYVGSSATHSQSNAATGTAAPSIVFRSDAESQIVRVGELPGLTRPLTPFHATRQPFPRVPVAADLHRVGHVRALGVGPVQLYLAILASLRFGFPWSRRSVRAVVGTTSG